MSGGLAVPGQSSNANGDVIFRDAVTQREVKVTSLKQIGGKSFYLESKQWVDSTATEKQITSAQTLQRYSKQYFELASQHGPAVGQYLSLSGTVIVVIDGQAYKVIDSK